jgi:hypothetical protein
MIRQLIFPLFLVVVASCFLGKVKIGAFSQSQWCPLFSSPFLFFSSS